MLRVRNFAQGEDEKVWINLLNQAFSDYEDRRLLTFDDIMTLERSPRFDAAGMLIAEFNGKPAGCVDARVDKERKEKKGFIRDLGVIPEFRRKGIGRELLNKAIENLVERGMEYAETYIDEDRAICKNLVESADFTAIRTSSEMAFDLTQIPSMLDEHKGVTMRTLNKKSLKDIRLFNSLHNEAFKEHFDFRPSTLEEARFWIQHNSWVDVSEYFIADLSSAPVGFVGVGIDTKCNEYRNRLRGWVFTIGVLKSHRLIGVGTALMLHGIKHLRSEGMEEAVLWVDDQNPTKAIKLYEKVGFKVIKKSLCYLRELT